MRKALPLLLMLLSPQLRAADFCVSTVDELEDALAGASVSEEADVILLEEGEYLIGFPIDTSEYQSFDGGLTLAGGFGADCASRKFGAQHTALIGTAGTSGVVLSPNGSLFVSDLEFRDFAWGVFLALAGSNGLRISRVGVFGTTEWFDPLGFAVETGTVVVDNLAVDATSGTGCSLFALGEPGSTIAIEASTLINRHASDSSALCFYGSANPQGVVGTIVGSMAGPSITAGAEVDLRHSMFSGTIDGTLAATSVENLNVPFAGNAAADGPHARYLRNEPAGASNPAIDSSYPFALDQFPYDVLGRPRLAGAWIDRGAIEVQGSDALLADGFE